MHTEMRLIFSRVFVSNLIYRFRSPWKRSSCSPIRLTQDKVEFWFQVCNFAAGFSVYCLAFNFEFNRIFKKILDRDWFSAYLSRNRRAITWVSNYRCPIWKSLNRTPVIGYPRNFYVNHSRFNGFLSNVFCSFQDLGKALRTFSLKRSF